MALVFTGAMIGGLAVYNYYNFTDSSRTDSEGAGLKSASAYLKFKEIKSSLALSGIPDGYGRDLNISFDRVQDAIDTVAPFDLTYGKNKINLSEGEMKRYINIGFRTSCKHCCGVKTLVLEDGKAACGCAHSQMMRGLSAYLIKNYSELSDERILEELNAWRTVYFPKQTLIEKLTEMERAGEPGVKEIMEEFPGFLPQMVGSC